MNSNYKRWHRPDKNSRYRQGYYKIINKEKYLGNTDEIIYRSSYEYKFCRYCDINENVLKWSSEPFAIKYYDPVNKKYRNYYVDFYAKIKHKNGEIKEYLIEVKPEMKLKMPVLEGRKTVKKLKNYNYALQEYLINKAKIKAAMQYAEKMGYEYLIASEEFLNGNV